MKTTPCVRRVRACMSTAPRVTVPCNVLHADTHIIYKCLSFNPELDKGSLHRKLYYPNSEYTLFECLEAHKIDFMRFGKISDREKINKVISRLGFPYHEFSTLWYNHCEKQSYIHEFNLKYQAFVQHLKIFHRYFYLMSPRYKIKLIMFQSEKEFIPSCLCSFCNYHFNQTNEHKTKELMRINIFHTLQKLLRKWAWKQQQNIRIYKKKIKPKINLALCRDYGRH